jgi:hypothetical protein
MSPWMRKLLGEREQICYGYGEKGEFYYLQQSLGSNRMDNPRFRELSEKTDWTGGYWSCTLGLSQKHVIKKTGSPLAKKSVPESFEYDEEWEYQRFTLLFKNGRLVDVRPKGTEHPEYLWRETYIPF